MNAFQSQFLGKEAVKALPLERLLLETDSPSLAAAGPKASRQESSRCLSLSLAPAQRPFGGPKRTGFHSSCRREDGRAQGRDS